MSVLMIAATPLAAKRFAQDHPIQTAGQQLLGPLGRAHATAQLHRDVQGGCDRLDHLIVHRLARAGAIEVHQVQPFRPLALPVEGLGHRIAAEARHLVVVALVQAHALTVQQVDGGDDLHGGGCRQRLPARLPEPPIAQLSQGHHQAHAPLQHRLEAGGPVAAPALLPQHLEVAVPPAEAEAWPLGGPALLSAGSLIPSSARHALTGLSQPSSQRTAARQLA